MTWKKRCRHETGHWSDFKTARDLIWDLFLFLFYSLSAWWLCRKRSLCEQRSQTQNTDGHKREGEKRIKCYQMAREAQRWIMDSTERNYGWNMRDQLWIHTVYLIVKRSVGPLFDWSLFLLISDLNNHAGVDVFPNQLPGFCDVNGNLWNKVKRNSCTF